MLTLGPVEEDGGAVDLIDVMAGQDGAASSRRTATTIPKRLFRKGLSGGALDDSSKLSRPSWRYHVEPNHPRAA